MTTAPTRIGGFIEATSGNYSSASNSLSAASVTVATDDLVIMTISAADGLPQPLQPSHTGTASITWTRLTEAPTSYNVNVSYVCAWKGVVTAGGTMVITVTKNGSGSGHWGFSAALYRDHGGVGNVNSIANTGTASPQLAVTCSANSALIGQINDWNAVDGSTRAWLEVPTGTVLAESLYYFGTGMHTVYGARAPDVGAAGSKTFGLSAPTGQRPAIVVVEVLGIETALNGRILLEGTDRILAENDDLLVTEDYVSSGVSGVVATTFGGTFTVAGNDRSLGVVATTFGGTFTTAGVDRALGVVASSFGGTLTTAGRPRKVGVAASSFGGTLTTAGTPITPAVTGVVASSFGGTFTTVGTDRALGTVASNFGGAFLGAGNDRQFGTAVSLFGGTLVAVGTDRTLGSTVSAFGGTLTTVGLVRKIGATVSGFGGTFIASGTNTTPPVTGSATSTFGGTFTTAGIDRVVGAATSNFGGAFLGAGNDRQLGTVASDFGGTLTTVGVRQTAGAAVSSFGGTFTTTGIIVGGSVFGSVVSSFGGTITTYGYTGSGGISPVRVGGYIEPTTGNYSTNTSPKSAPQRTDFQTGDLVIVTGSAEAGIITELTPSHTGTAAITWTRLTETTSISDSLSYACAWKGEVTGSGTATVSVTAAGGSSYWWGFSASLYRAHGGVGNIAQVGNAPSGYPALALTCSANSALIGQANDWNAVDGASRAWLIVNGIPIFESLYYRDSSHHTVYGGRSANVGVAGTKTWGLSSPSGTRSAVVLVEVLVGAIAGQQGAVASAFGGTFTTAGVNRVVGAVASNFGGAFLGAGSNRLFGSVASEFGGTFDTAGYHTQYGSVASGFGGTFDTTGNRIKFGAAVSEFGGTATTTGIDRVLGAISASFGGTLDVAGVITPPAGVGSVASLFGGTFTTSGTRRRPGSVSSNFGGAFLGAGNDRQFGAAVSAFGGTITVAGVDRQFGAAVSAFGFVVDVNGVSKTIIFGQVTSLFGGVFTVQTQPSTIFFLSAGVFTALEMSRAEGNTWMPSAQTILSV